VTLLAYNGNGSYSSASWYDEFNVSLGAALQPAATAPAERVYRRDFQNGIVLVNPRGNGTQTVTLGGTFHKSSARRIQPLIMARRSPRSP